MLPDYSTLQMLQQTPTSLQIVTKCCINQKK